MRGQFGDVMVEERAASLKTVRHCGNVDLLEDRERQVCEQVCTCGLRDEVAVRAGLVGTQQHLAGVIAIQLSPEVIRVETPSGLLVEDADPAQVAQGEAG